MSNPDKGNEWWRAKRRRLIASRGGKCGNCGATEQLEFAHKKPTGLNGRGRGFKDRVRDVMLHPRR